MACKCTLGLGLGLFLATITSHAQGSFTIYTDRSSWETAAGGGTGNIFDALNTGTLNRTNYTVSGTAQNAFPNGNAATTIDSSGYVRVLLQSASSNYTVFTFNNPVMALGYDVNPQSFNLGVAVQLTVDGAPAGSYNLPVTDVNGFFGIVATASFTALRVTTTASTAWHGIDNLEAFSATPVPEPSVMALSLFGVASGWLMRRRGSKSV